jgi:proteasome lid subunit RPN8/RPN11
VIQIPAAVLSRIVQHAEIARPLECCGVLLGRLPDVISGAVEVRNAAEVPDRYLLDPKGHLDARRLARADGLEIVGFYHSHPHSSARPSVRDISEANYPGHFYLIVALGDTQPEIRLYRLADGNFAETPYVTVT